MWLLMSTFVFMINSVICIYKIYDKKSLIINQVALRLLKCGGLVAARDIVQFVELRNFLQGGGWSKELLAKAVLAEIPAQLSGWMKLKSLKPRN